MPINLDGKPDNADWTKVTADLPATRESLLQFLAQQHLTVDQFRRLSVYRWNSEYFDRLLHGAPGPPEAACQGDEQPEVVPQTERLQASDYVDLDTLLEWQARILTGRPKPDDLGATLSRVYDDFAKGLAEAPRGAVIDFPND